MKKGLDLLNSVTVHTLCSALGVKVRRQTSVVENTIPLTTQLVMRMNKRGSSLVSARGETAAFISREMSACALQASNSSGGSGNLFGPRQHFRMAGTSIIRRQNKKVDVVVDRFGEGGRVSRLLYPRQQRLWSGQNAV